MKKGLGVMKEYGGVFGIFFLLVSFMIFGLNQAKSAQREEALLIAQESIMRGAIRCYALEGAFPPSYEYLKENYGIQIDEENYTVFYDIFASNMMPDVIVLEK